MCKQVRRFAAASVASGLCAMTMISSAPGAQTTENFDSDPGWIFSDPPPTATSSPLQDYGYQPASNFAGGANAGEAGGIMDVRKAVGPPRATYYAAEVTGLTSSTSLQATGRYGWDELEGVTARDNGGWHFGWFSTTDWDSANQYFPQSGIMFHYGSRNHFLTVFRPGGADGGGLRREDFALGPDPKVPSIDGCIGNEATNCTGATGGKTFDLQYDPNANGGLGAASIVITDSNNITYSATLNLTAEERASFDARPLDRFGIFVRHSQALDDPSGDTRATRAWFDDMTYTSSAAVVAVPGDYNNNGTVDAADYVVWRDGGPLQNEVASIGTVNTEDYDAWKARFGSTSGSGSGIGTSAVPEPTSALLLTIGLLGVWLRRCR